VRRWKTRSQFTLMQRTVAWFTPPLAACYHRTPREFGVLRRNCGRGSFAILSWQTKPGRNFCPGASLMFSEGVGCGVHNRLLCLTCWKQDILRRLWSAMPPQLPQRHRRKITYLYDRRWDMFACGDGLSAGVEANAELLRRGRYVSPWGQSRR
jgi:hypothetical protein